MPVFYEKKNQNNSWSSLPYPSSSFVVVGKGNTIQTHESLPHVTSSASTAPGSQSGEKPVILFKMKRNNF